MICSVDLSSGRQTQERRGGGSGKVARAMPACPVQDDHAVRTRATAAPITARCSFIDAVFALSATWAMPTPRRWRRTERRGHGDGRGRCFPVEQTRVVIPFRPTRASSWNPISTGPPSASAMSVDVNSSSKPATNALCRSASALGWTGRPETKRNTALRSIMRAPLLRMDDPEGLLDFPHDVPNTPARHTVPLTIGTRLGPRADLGDLRLRQAPLAPAAGTIHKASALERSTRVAQDLSSRSCARAASVRDAPSMTIAIARARGLLRAPAVLRQRMEFVRCVFRPGHRRCRTQQHPPTVVNRSSQSMDAVRLVTTT